MRFVCCLFFYLFIFVFLFTAFVFFLSLFLFLSLSRGLIWERREMKRKWVVTYMVHTEKNGAGRVERISEIITDG